MYANKLSTALLLVLLGSPIAHGAEVVAERPDNLGGQMIGGWSAVLIGGALGGPAGAILGGLTGAWLGGELQEIAGMSGNAYLIEAGDGKVQRYRSPRRTFEVGDRVAIKGIRPVPAEQDGHDITHRHD